jgi:hypothetical protein
MSTQARADLESDAQRLERYLRQRGAAEGEFYFKSKFITDEVGLSPSQIGNLLPELEETAEGLEIERWAYTNATTWRVAPQQAATPSGSD